VLATLALLALPATAAAQRCDAPVAADGMGDANEPYLDVTAGWFSTKGDDLLANIRVRDLQQRVPGGASAVRWSMNFRRTAGSDWRHVSARLTADGRLSFTQGHRHPDAEAHDPSTPYHDEAETTGRLVEGTDGVVQIRLQELTARDAGKKLDSIWVETRVLTGFESQADSSPLSGDGPSWTIARCDVEPAASGPSAAAGAAAAGGPGGSATGPGSSESSTRAAGLTTAIDLRAVRRKVASGRRVALFGSVGAFGRRRVELLAGDALRRERVVAATTTLDDGSFAFSYVPRLDTNLRARAGAVLSALTPVRVRATPRFSVRRRNGRVTVSGTVRPASRGLATLLRFSRGRWRSEAVMEITRGRFRLTVASLPRGRYRVETHDLVGVAGRAASSSRWVGP
jgi:hypothetical protein